MQKVCFASSPFIENHPFSNTMEIKATTKAFAVLFRFRAMTD